MRTIMIVCALVLGVVSLGSVSARNNKMDICHYQEENDGWKLLSVGQPAAGAHLEHHDDALPGGTTSQTGTVLDADCEVVEVICPCDYRLFPQTADYWLPGDPLHFHTFRSEQGPSISDGELCVLFSEGVVSGQFLPFTSISVIARNTTSPGESALLTDCDDLGNFNCSCQGFVALDDGADPFFDNTFFMDGLTSDEAFACASEINSYAFELNNVAGISVMSEGDVPCRTAP